MKVLVRAVVRPRHAGERPMRRNRALTRCVRVQGIIAENSALRVLLDPIGVDAVFIRIPVDADPSIGMRRMPTTGLANIML